MSTVSISRQARNILSAMICCLVLSGCGVSRSAMPMPPPIAGEATITAKTAYLLLKSKISLGDRRLLRVESAYAPRGFAPSWHITLASILDNEIGEYEIPVTGPIPPPRTRAFNPVFDTEAPLFSEAQWLLDSSEAVRALGVAPEEVRRCRLEADDNTSLYWEFTLSDGSRQRLAAGKTTLDTPAPPQSAIRGKHKLH